MPTEFYFKIQDFNFDWKITITLLHSHLNTQQRQVHDVTATVGKTPTYKGLWKIWKSAYSKKLFYVYTLNSMAPNFTEI